MNKIRYFLSILTLILLIVPVTSRANFTSLEVQSFGVKNTSRGESAYLPRINIVPGEELEFVVGITNPSQETASNLLLNVYLPPGLALATNSIRIDGYQTSYNISSGLPLRNLSGGSQRFVIFRTTANSSLKDYYDIYANLSGDNFGSINKYVTVTNSSTSNGTNSSNNSSYNYNYYSYYSGANYNNSGNQIGILSVSNLVKNISKGGSAWQKTVKADPEDLLQFSIMITGDKTVAVKNVYLKDYLDDLLDLVPGTVTLNDMRVSDVISDGKLSLGDFQPKEAKFLKLQTRVAPLSRFTQTQVLLTNSAEVISDNLNLNKVTNDSSVSITIGENNSDSRQNNTNNQNQKRLISASGERPATRIIYLDKAVLELTKTARNVTQEQKDPAKQITANPGDEIEFTIQMSSATDRKIENIILKDQLPEKIDYIFNSARMGKEIIGDEIVRNGLSLGNLNLNQIKTITYRGRILPEKEFDKNETLLKNSVEAKAANAQTVKDSVEITVKTKNINLFGGVIAFGNLGFLLLLTLLAAVVLLATFLTQEKKKNQNKQI